MGQIKISEEAATPEIPPAGFFKIYVKTDGVVYLLDENGVETPISNSDVLVNVSGNDTVAGYLEDKILVSSGSNATTALEISTLNEGADEDLQIQFDQSKISLTASQVSDFTTAVQSAETDTTIQKIGNTLRYIGEDGTNQDVDLSSYLDDTNLARLVSGTLNPTTGILTVTRDDATTFTIDLSGLLDDTNTDNTASNVGTAGVGVFKQKTGINLEFKNINAGSNKVSITDDVANNEIDIDVNEGNLNITASQVSDFDTEVSNNTDVAANTSARHDAVTLNAGAPTQESANLVGQEIELNQATITTDGVMSSEDKTKLDGIASGANNYSHPNHSGEVTSIGDGAQALDKTSISNKTQVVAAASDYVLIGDSSDIDNLKKVTVQSIADLSNAGLATKAGSVAGVSFVTVSGSRVYDVVFSSAFSDANYSVNMICTDERVWTYSNKVSTGFRIKANSNNSLSGETVDWVAIKHGES